MNTTEFNKKLFGKTSRYIGVSWNKKNDMWQVHCYHGNKTHYLGQYFSEENAGNAYNNFVKINKLEKTLNLTRIEKKKRGITSVVIQEERTWYGNVKVKIQTIFRDIFQKEE